MKRIPTNLRLMLAALFAVCLGVSAWAGFSSMFTPSVSYPESASVAPAQPAAPAPAKVKAAAPAIDFTAAGNYQLFWDGASGPASSPSDFGSINTDSPWGFYRYNVADGTYTRFTTYDTNGSNGTATERGTAWYTDKVYCFVSNTGHYHSTVELSPAIVFTAPADGIYYATITVWRDKADKTNTLRLRSRLIGATGMQCDKENYIFAKAYGTKDLDGVDGKQPQTLDFFIRLNAGQQFTFETESYTTNSNSDGRTHISDLSVSSCKAANQPFTLEEAQAYERFYDATATTTGDGVNYDATGNYHLFKTEADVTTADASFSQNNNTPWGFYRYVQEDGTYTAFANCDQSGKNGSAEGRGDAWYTGSSEYCFVSNTGHFHPTNGISPAIMFTAPSDGIYFATITVWRDKEKQANTLYLRSRLIEGNDLQCDKEKVLFEKPYGTVAVDAEYGKTPQTLDFFIRVKAGQHFTFEIGDTESAGRTHITNLCVASCRDTGTPFTIDEAKAYARFYDAVGDEQPASSITATWVAADQNYGNGEVVETANIDNTITASFNKGTNNNAPKYYTTGTGVRVYGGGYFTLSGATITKVVFTFGSGEGSNAITSDVGTYENGTWTGSAESITFTVGGTSGHRRIAGITVEYTGGTTPVVTVNPPVIQPESGTFFDAKEVIITADQGDEIWYSLNDGADQQYTAAFTVSETTKVTAYAKDNAGNESAKVTSTFTIAPTFTSCAAANAAATSTKIDARVTLTDALVTYVIPDIQDQVGRAYVEDATGGLLIYGSHKFNVGDKFTGSIEGKFYAYNGLPELLPYGYTDLSVTSFDNPVVPTEVDAAALAANPLTYVSMYVKVKPATFAAATFSGKNVNFTVGESAFVLRDNFSVAPTFNTEDNFSVAGLVTIYGDEIELFPTKPEDVAVMGAAPMYSNLDFEASIPITDGICTYSKDMAGNGVTHYGLQAVEGWTIAMNASDNIARGQGEDNELDQKAGGVAQYGSGVWFGKNTYIIPATGPEGSNGQQGLGITSVWGGDNAIAQYTQDVTLPAGNYVITVPIYNANSAGTNSLAQNLIGFIANNGTKYLATTTKYPVGQWYTETISFTLAEETAGKLSIGIQHNSGSGNAPCLIIDRMDITTISDADIARAELKAAIEPAEATVTAAAKLGDGIFQYALETYNTYAQAVADAKNVADDINATAEQLRAAKDALAQATQAYTVTAPTQGQAYIIELKNGGTFMALNDGTKQASDPTELFFEAIEGGWAITDGQGNYVAQAGSNPWNMNASTTPFAWTISSVADGEYTIAQASAPTNFIGIDNPATAGNKCYANKGASDNIVWLINQAAPHFQATSVDVNITRMVGQGTTAQTETIDFAEAKAYLGVDELKPYMVSIINPDGVVEFDYAQYGGWFDTTGKATTETDLGNNPGICLNFPEALTSGTFSVCDKNGADVVGQTYTVKWEFQANSKGYIYKFHISFVENTQQPATDGADLAAENAAADQSVTDGTIYRIFTQDDSGTKFYMTTDGYLTANVDEAALLPLKKISFTGDNAIDVGTTRYDVVAFKFNACYSNPQCVGNSATGAIDPQGHLMLNSQNRDNQESQVFFLGAESGKYAVRCTAAYSVKNGVSNRWNAQAYWTITDVNSDGLPEAEYRLEADYRWQLEEPELQLADGDDPALENAAAAASVTAGHTYRLFTQNSAGAKFYMKSDGYLTANEDEAALLPMKFVSRTGSNAVNIGDQRIDVTAFKLGAYTNPKCSEFGDFEPQGHIMIYNNGTPRDDYESQVFFLGSESGKYAIRATAKYNVNSSGQLRWSAHTYWTTTGSDALPEAEYSLTPNYCWELEDATYDIPAEFPNPDAKYTIKNRDADLYVSFDTSQDRVVLSEAPVELFFESDGSGGWYITDGANYLGLDGGWNISASPDKKSPVTFSAITSGDDILYVLNEANGVVGTDNLAAGEKCYSDKTVASHGYWILTEIEPVPEVAIYSKITSAEGLVAGAKYLIVNEEASVALGALSTTSTKYGTTVDVTIANSRIDITDEAVDVITLDGSAAGWTFASSLAEGYLNWTTGNSLTLNTAADDDAKWTITFDEDGNATIANVATTARILSYNASNPRFATYGNMNQKRVQLYKAGRAPGNGIDFVFNDEGTQSFGLAGNKDITGEDNTSNVINVTKNDIKDGIVVKYDNVDIEGTETHRTGFCASAKITDSQGNTYQVKTLGNDNNVIYVAKGLFGPNEEYEVTIQPIVYYNFEEFCDGIYELWESEKENHKIMEADGKSWHLDPNWTLKAAAQQWSQDLKNSGSIAYNGDAVDFEYCDPLPCYVDNTPHKFIIKTDNSVQANVKELGTQNFQAWDAWGNEFTAEFLNAHAGDTPTAIDGIEGSQNANGRIYNMAGQRVAKTTKGLYIVNGKKIAVK